MSLAARIAVACLSLVLLMALLSAYQLHMIQRLQTANEELGQIRYTAARLTLEVQRRVEELEELTAKYFLLRDLAYAQALDRLRAEVDGRLAELESLNLSAAEEQVVATLALRWRRYRQRALAELEASEVIAPQGAGVRASDGGSILAALAEVGHQLQRLQTASRQAAVTQIGSSSRRVEKVVWASWAVAAAGLVVAALATLLIVRSVAVPLGRLARGTRELSSGDLSHRVTPAGSPEVAALAADFNVMAERLSELDRLKRDFVSHVSHDLKAPLASMEETLRLLQEGIPDPLTGEQEHLVGLALKSARRLSTLIANLLDLARLDAGVLSYRFADEDLAALVETAAQGLASLLPEKGLQLDLDLPPAAVPVCCDGPAILRVLDNLLANAVAFSPPGGTIEVSVRHGGGPGAPGSTGGDGAAPAEAGWPPAAVVEIADRGPGIPAGKEEKIFERFYQDRPGGPGTGLGLAIARAVAQGHGGTVSVRSRPEGGSVFTLLLPPAERGAPAGRRDGVQGRDRVHG